MFNKSVNPHLNELLAGSALAFVVKIFSAMGTFILNIVIARSLSIEQAGYFFLAQAIIIFSAVIARQGFDNALVRFIASYRVNDEDDHIAGIYRYSLIRIIPILLIFSSLLCVGSNLISSWVFNKPLLSGVLIIGALAVLPISITQLHGFCLQGEKRVTLAMLFNSTLLSLTTLIIIWISEPLTARQAMIGYLFSAVICFFISSIVWNKVRKNKNSFFSNYEKKSVAAAIKPLFFILLFSQAFIWVGRLMLGVWGSTTDVALFSLAQQTATLPIFILVAVNSIAAPKFAEAYKQERFDDLNKIAIYSSRIMVMIATPVILFMMFFSEWLMGLFGDDYIYGANVLRILAVGQFINVITGPVSYLLQMTGNERALMNNYLISFLFMMVGFVFFIPYYGIYGAAFVTAISIVIQGLLCVYQIRERLGFNILNLFRQH